jgi:hypothetical protein
LGFQLSYNQKLEIMSKRVLSVFVGLLLCATISFAQQFNNYYPRTPDSTCFIYFSDFGFSVGFNMYNRFYSAPFKKSEVFLEYEGFSTLILCSLHPVAKNNAYIRGLYKICGDNKTDTVTFYRGIELYDTIVPVFRAEKTGTWSFYKNDIEYKKEVYLNGKLQKVISNGK